MFRWLAWLEQHLLGRHPLRRLLVLALALGLPTLGNGLLADDRFFKARSLQGPFGRLLGPPSQLFDGDSEALRPALLEAGLRGWWSSSQTHLSFWRPIASWQHVLEFRTFPDSEWLMHLHSVLWFVAMTAAVYWAQSEIGLSKRLAALATLIYTVDDAHGFALGWLCNRNAFLASTFAACALALGFGGARRDQRWREWAAAPLWFAAFTSAELGASWFPYVLAWVAFVDTRRWMRRLEALVPPVLAVVVWRVAYAQQGASVAGHKLYVTPGSLAFWRAFPGRLVLLLEGQWGLVWSEAGLGLSPLAHAVLVLVCAAFLIVCARALAPILRRSREARMAAVGSVLACLPVAATVPADRLLFAVGFGTATLVALLLESKTAFARVLVAVHLVIAPPLFVARALLPKALAYWQTGIASSLPTTPQLAGRSLVVVNAPPSFSMCHQLPIWRESLGLENPARVRCLGTTGHAIEVTRPADETIELFVAEGYLGEGVFFSWNESYPFHVGDEVVLSDMRIVVKETTDDGRPRRILFRLAEPLDSDRWRWTALVDGRLRTFSPPARGEKITLRAFDLGATLRGFFAK